MGTLNNLDDKTATAVDSLLNVAESENEKDNAVKEIQDFLSTQNDSSNILPDQPDLGDSPTYERLEYETLTDEELTQNATDSLADYLNSGTNSIDNEYANLESKYEEDKVTASNSANSKLESVESAYGTAKESINNDTLTRGLARSSIAVIQNANVDLAKADSVTAITNELNSTLESLANEISSLEVARQKALDDFNITYAVKLTETINDLKTSQQDKMEEVIKYNNTLTEKEFDDNITLEESQASIYGDLLDNKLTENELLEQAGVSSKDEALYDKVVEVLSGLNSADARDLILNNEYIKNTLDPYYYSRVYNQFVRAS